MNILLKEFQEETVQRLVRQIRRAANESRFGDPQAVCLSSTTGSGKTVMLTRAIEILLGGDDENAAIPDATFLWITDQPELNEQTRRKMAAMSSHLSAQSLVVLDTTFDQETLHPGTVHFLNTQKLGREKSLVTPGDSRTFTLWDTIKNTIEARPDRLFVIIDEAHRGMLEDEVGAQQATTIIQKFIKGSHGEVPLVPVVIGVSATPERFNSLIVGTGRANRPVDVDVAEVRASGLIKDVIVVHHPKKEQPTDMTLLREAAKSLKAFATHWAKHCATETDFVVVPLMVVQVEDSHAKGQISETDLGQAMRILMEELGGLHASSFAHAFQEGSTLRFGAADVRYIAPSDIEADRDVRVVFFKTSLNTGWDCPRAEVMMSFRAASDSTHIAQLVGRMVRTPLARRIVHDEVLNTVALYLPHYDAKGLEKVVEKLSRPDGGVGPVDILRADDLLELRRAPGSARAFDALSQLPSYTVPRKRKASQVHRLMKLARLLTNDDIDEDAFSNARDHLLRTLDQEHENRRTEPRFRRIVDERGEIEIDSVNWDVGTESLHQAGTTKVNIAAENLDDLFEATGRKLREGLHKEWWRRRVKLSPSAKDQAKLELFALCVDPEVIRTVEKAAQSMVQKCLQQHRVAIAKLDEKSRASYDEIRSLASTPELTSLIYPEAIFVRRAQHKIEHHLYVADDGEFHIKLNNSESKVLTDALSADDVVGWLRNVDRKAWALCVPYQVDGEDRAFFPDFLVVRTLEDTLVVDLIEPHSVGLADAPAKAVGLAKFAAKHSDKFGRILLVLLDDSGEKYIDLADEAARLDVMAITSIEHLRSLLRK